MTLSVKEQTAVSRLRSKLKKQPHGSIAESLGVSRASISAWKQVMRAIGVDCPASTPGRKAGSATITTAVMAKALRSKSNGAHAR
jgi:biotin operon repressor